MTPFEMAVLDTIAAELRNKASAVVWPKWATEARRLAMAAEIESVALALRQAEGRG